MGKTEVDLPVYFVRHNWRGKMDMVINDLLSKASEVAIHFDNLGLDETKYKNGRTGPRPGPWTKLS
jgi:hypothetical protein